MKEGHGLSTLAELQRELDETRAIIRAGTVDALPSLRLHEPGLLELDESPSLLQRCDQLLSATEDLEAGTIRTVHHFACTGGTLICKAIAALPNTYLLSELHPNPPLRKVDNAFAPSDIALLAKAAQIPNASKLAEKILLKSIIETHKWARLYGGQVVLRDHSHSDFCVGAASEEASTITQLCDNHFSRRRSVVTVRHPLDSWLSLSHHKWVHFTPEDFEEYCKRYHAFLDALHGYPILRYEDFVASPKKTLDLLCNLLELPKSDTAEFTFSLFRLSGDSGRSHTRISGRSRRAVTTTPQLTTSYEVLLERLGYTAVGA